MALNTAVVYGSARRERQGIKVARFHSELLLAVRGALCGTQKQPGAAMR